MSIFSNESKLLIENWEAVTDIFNAKQRLEKELTGFLYSIENELRKTHWWQRNWDFVKQSSQIYISKRDWKVENDYIIWIGVEGFTSDNMFGYENYARLFVWVSKRNFELISMLREEIAKRQGEYIGEIDSRPSNQYIVRDEVKQFLPEELGDFENIVRNQILNFVECYARLLEECNEQIKELLK